MRLFVNLLEYEMGIAIFLCRFNIPVNGHGLALYWCAIDFGDRDASGTQRYNFALIHDENMAGVFLKGGGVRRPRQPPPPHTNNNSPPSPPSDQPPNKTRARHNTTNMHAIYLPQRRE